MSIEDEILRSRTRNQAWDKTARHGYWTYKPGERARLAPRFEAFYQQHRAEWRDVLDIGCGTGKFMIPMLQDGLHVVGVEPSDGMRQSADNNLRLAGLEGKAILLNGESKKLDLPDESFDLVLAKGSIHHNTWEDIQQSFREASRVLRKGQYFIFQGRSPKDPALARSVPVEAARHTAQDTKGVKQGVVEHYFTKEELEQLAQENGLQIVLGPEEIVREEKGNARWWVVYKKAA